MKYLIFLFCLIVTTADLSAQKLSVGLMGGFNSSLNSFKSQNTFINSFDSKLGYNANLFLGAKFSGFLIQPEFGYYNNRISVSGVKDGKSLEVGISIGDIYGTFLLGYSFSHFRFLLGPLMYSTGNVIYEKPKTEILSIQNANLTNLKYGAQAGIGFDISRHWRIDGRIQKTFTTSNFNVEYQDKKTETISGSLGAVSLSMGYNFLKNF